MTTKYLIIHNEILNQIQTGEIAAHSLLPSENELKDLMRCRGKRFEKL